MILDNRLLRPDSYGVLDFSLYSAFVLAELMAFLDGLGNEIANHLGVVGDGIPSIRVGNFKQIASSMDRLAETFP
jgi:hypothetical protein